MSQAYERCANCVCSALNRGFRQNPVVTRVIGLCPLLALTDSVIRATTIGVLMLVSVILVSSISAWCRATVVWQLKPLYATVLSASIAALVISTATILNAGLIASLGVYVYLIAVNCLVFAQIYEYSEHNPARDAVKHAAFESISILVVLIVIASVREFFAYGAIFTDMPLLSGEVDPIPTEPAVFPFAAAAPGALFALALLLALANYCRLFVASLGEPTRPETRGG